MRNRRFRGSDFEILDKDEFVIEFESDDVLKERVLRNDFKKIYTLSDISKWVEYGLRKGVIKKSNKKEDIEMVMKWIDLLGKGGKSITLN